MFSYIQLSNNSCNSRKCCVDSC